MKKPMSNKAFMAIVKYRQKYCFELLNTKGDEYGSNKPSRFHAFHRAAAMKGESPIKALEGMHVKHEVSIKDMIDHMDADPTYVPSQAYINAKLSDSINYLLLLEGLIEERRLNLDGNSNV